MKAFAVEFQAAGIRAVARSISPRNIVEQISYCDLFLHNIVSWGLSGKVLIEKSRYDREKVVTETKLGYQILQVTNSTKWDITHCHRMH